MKWMKAYHMLKCIFMNRHNNYFLINIFKYKVGVWEHCIKAWDIMNKEWEIVVHLAEFAIARS